jgi:IS5 family transposase
MSGIIFGNNRVLRLNDPGWNTQNFIERLRHVRGTRLARLIERLYIRPGGLHTQKVIAEIKAEMANMNALKNKNPNTRPNRNNFNSNEAFNRAMNNWRRRGAPGSSKG